ncbi:CDK-activating kinase assembly factor MAT1 [Pseudolycoriella hygida]|uniref:CDK-activating kinase assembly factor MAT1 n=1 Tax=Pseudolycoriella hygida TaxID=35572 RepID=A0A9Q0NFQ9_9DIPT|nr:CDK-activating kinase assembly factor MAT1 [Pseudolycoriella hygida]
MDDQVCPRCKTTKYRNPSLKLLVNVCGHTLCESCVDLLFLKGAGSCPECNVPLRRSNFRVQLFEEPKVEKEIDIRRRILRDFNKKEEDFATEAEYNDYLEEMECIVYNLCNNIDVVNTNKKIEQYKKDNRDLIMKNKSRLGREEYELEMELEREKQLEADRKKELLQIEQELKKRQMKEKEALIDELMSSHADAATIVSDYAKQAEKIREESKVVPVTKNEFSSGVKFGQQAFLPVPKVEEGPLYTYQKPILASEGPQPPKVEDIETKGYINFIRAENAVERAGGYRSVIACQRALQEALQGLFHSK